MNLLHQDNVGEILEKNGADSPLKMTGPSPMKPRSLQPPHTGGRTRITSPLKPIHPDESENMNPDEVIMIGTINSFFYRLFFYVLYICPILFPRNDG